MHIFSPFSPRCIAPSIPPSPLLFSCFRRRYASVPLRGLRLIRRSVLEARRSRTIAAAACCAARAARNQDADIQEPGEQGEGGALAPPSWSARSRMSRSQQKLSQSEREEGRGDGRRVNAGGVSSSQESLVPLFSIGAAVGPGCLTAACVCARLSVSKLLRADQSPFAASAPGCFSSYYTPLPFFIPFILHVLSQPSSHSLFLALSLFGGGALLRRSPSHSTLAQWLLSSSRAISTSFLLPSDSRGEEEEEAAGKM